MSKAARVLVLLCVLQPAIEGSSVAGLQRRSTPRTRLTAAAKRADSKRAVPRLRRTRALRRMRPPRPVRTTHAVPRPPPALSASATAPAEIAPRGGRLRRFSSWSARVLGVRGAITGVQRVLQYLRPGKRVSDLSASGLTFAGSRSLGAVQPAIAAVSGVAGVTLAAASALELARARNHIERADAAHGVAWGLQSIGGIGGMWWNAPGWAAPTAFGLGLTGGGIQTAVGLYRIRTGIQRRDRRMIILGALDTGAGASWIASTVTGNPLTLGAFFGLTGVRLLYTNAHRLKALPRRTARLASRLLARASRSVDRLLEGDRPRFARTTR